MTQTIESLVSQIQRLRQRIEELENQEKRLDLVIKSTGVGIWDWYVQTGETVFNERWANIIGYTLEEISPVSIETWIKYAHPDDLKESDRLLKENWAGKTEYYIFESRMKHKNGHWVWVYDTGQVIEWESEGVPKRMIGTHLDITEQKQNERELAQANKKLEELSYIDSLTQIPNRRAYDKRLSEVLSSSKRSKTTASLIVIDIDHFKQYNDIYGHEKGDVVLKEVAKQVESALPRKTDFAARYGGEEIVVILPFTNIKQAAFVAGRLLECIVKLSIEHSYSRFNSTLTVSMGISSTDEGFDELMAHADRALYLAKKNGRNRYEIYANK